MNAHTYPQDTRFAALGSDAVSEAILSEQFKPSAVDVDKLELRPELTGVCRPRRLERQGEAEGLSQ